MGKLIGSGNTENFGEKVFIDKAQEYLDDTNIIYWNRQLFGREFDVCILMPGKGILVVELKGWREENILRVENNEAVIIRTADGEVAASPQKQARGYRFSIERHLRKTIGKFPLVYQMVCLPQVSRTFFRSHRLDVVMEEKFTILKEDLVDNTAFFNKLDQALREVSNWNRDPFDRRTMLEVRNLYETDKKDILALIRAIEEINEIATYLFALDNSREDFINFGKHFHNLEEFLKQRELALANEQERALITALQLRLDKIKPENSTFSGTFRDLQQGLYYYLKQKNDEDQGVDWIVKNFEQIDGDILQSKRQFEKEQRKVYHFACVSDRDMNMTVNDQLPWPLTDEFIHAAYSPIDLQFQVYYTSLGERSNFLRYALFYGLCYNRCDVRLSYVKQYGDETTEPYALLAILGLAPKAELVESVHKSTPFAISVGKEITRGVKYDRYQMMDMFLCPYRFFLDYVMEDGPVVQGNFLYQKYFENLLIEAVWKRIGKQNRADAMKYLSQIMDQETQKLEPYFKFWKRTEIIDLKLRAKNYLIHEVITNGYGTTVMPYVPSHMQMRKLFGAALFSIDISEVEKKNPYGQFEALTKREGWKKIYSLHKLPKPDNQALADSLRGEAKEYLNQTCGEDKAAISSDWCTYCVHRGNCMESFLRSEISMSSSRDEP